MCFAAPASTIDGSSPGVTLCSRRYVCFSCVLLYDNRYVVGSFFVGGTNKLWNNHAEADSVMNAQS